MTSLRKAQIFAGLFFLILGCGTLSYAFKLMPAFGFVVASMVFFRFAYVYLDDDDEEYPPKMKDGDL